MKEILLTSSVLILAVVLLRLLFQKRVSRRLIYAAWLLVALRLMIPIQFGSLRFSVLSQAEPVTDAITQIVQKPVSGPSREEVYHSALQDYLSQGRPIFRPEVQEQVESEIQHSGRPAQDVYDALLESNPPESILLPEVNQQIENTVSETVKPTLGQIATVVWIAGMVGMALWFVGVNVSFRRKLRRSAAPLAVPECKTPVRVSPLLASPCLFGLLRPTVYLTPACVGDERKQRHVLTHELTHLRSGDHIWAWVRCLCLCVYWFNPLVWVAASLSRRDCELACDEAALKTLGEGERLAYGRTLLDMVSSVHAPGQLLETATAMHETKKQLKERMKCIVKKPKVFLTAAIILLMVLTVITGCAFSGVGSNPTEDTDPTTVPTTAASDPTAEPTTEPTTVPTTVPPTTETPTPTTERTPTFLSVENIPIPSQTAVLPESPTLEDLLLEPYTGSALWYSTGDEYSVTIELPLLVPFSDGAKAINESIRSSFMSKINDIRVAYKGGSGVFEKVVSYEAYLNGDVLSLIITGDTHLDYDYYQTYNLDISTGKELTKYDMIQRFAKVSYPEFLLHATYSVYNDPDLQSSSLLSLLENDPFSMSGYKPALDGSGRLMLYGHLSQMMCSTVTPYDPDAWDWDKEYTDWERGSYMWLFQRKTDGAYADALAGLFVESFFLDPEGFLRHLSWASVDINEHVADFVTYALHPDELSYFETLCGQYIAKDDTAKAARALMDAYKKKRNPELGSLEALFLSGSTPNYYNYAVGQEYTSPTELNLRYFFDHGFADERTPTEAELTELKQHIDEWWVEMAGFYRLPKDKMNEVLQTYFGITLADLPDTAYEGLTYLESTDCYYFFATGVFGVAEYFEALSVKHLDSSTVQLTYTKMAYPQWNFVVTMQYSEGSYRILSNTYAPGVTEDPEVLQYINNAILKQDTFADDPATANSLEFHEDCTITVRYTVDGSGKQGTLILKVLHNRLEILSNTLDSED